MLLSLVCFLLKETKVDRVLRKWTWPKQTYKQVVAVVVNTSLLEARFRFCNIIWPRHQWTGRGWRSLRHQLSVLSSQARRCARLILLWFYGWLSQLNQQCCRHCGNNKPQQIQGEALGSDRKWVVAPCLCRCSWEGTGFQGNLADCGTQQTRSRDSRGRGACSVLLICFLDSLFLLKSLRS